ncbi:MAG: transposase [Eubacteriales bacterium]|nr:transposase [Eubacteriales bacterium]
MKKTREIKLRIVLEHLEEGRTIAELSKQYGIDMSNVKCYINLFLKHGPSIFTDPEKQQSYSREMKLSAIKRHLVGGESMRSIAADIGLKDPGSLRDWVHKYRVHGEELYYVNSISPKKSSVFPGRYY